MKNGSRSNYADKSISEDRIGALPEHRLAFRNDTRGFTPNAGETDGEGKYGNLAASCIADNAFKSARFYPNDPGWIWSLEDMNEQYTDGYIQPPWRTAELEAQMPTFRGVPPSPAEMYRGQVFARA